MDTTVPARIREHIHTTLLASMHIFIYTKVCYILARVIYDSYELVK